MKPLNEQLRIYVCGRRSGLPDKGFNAIQGAVLGLRKKGFVVISPIEVNVNMLSREYSPPVDPRDGGYPQAFPGMRADIIAMLSVCNAVALMPGWETAIGCKLEVAVAITLGYTFVHWQDGEVVERPSHVTIDHGYVSHRHIPDSLPLATDIDSPARVL